MKAVRGFVVTVGLGVSLVLFWVSAFATPDVESDVTVPLIVFLLVAGQSNLSPSCDVVLYPQTDIGQLDKYLRPGCTLRLSENPQTVVVSASVNLNTYQWLPPNEAENDLVDPKRAISPTFSEKTVYWTLQWENGPPTRPINPPASRRRPRSPDIRSTSSGIRPVSPTFSIISGFGHIN